MLNVNSSLITEYLFEHFNAGKGYKYQICNSYVFKWESDFFCIAKSGYTYEIEVKISRSNYLADFRKEQKHQVLSGDGKYLMVKNHICEIDSWDQLKKYNYQLHRSSRIGFINLNQKRPNKFCFAVPTGMVEAHEVPHYAGLIYIDPDAKYRSDIIKIIKRPPVIHQNKIDLTKVLLDKYYWAYMRMIEKQEAAKTFEFPD